MTSGCAAASAATGGSRLSQANGGHLPDDDIAALRGVATRWTKEAQRTRREH
jgi:hypothetical protein